MNIAVYGASGSRLAAEYKDAAFELGRLIAAGGHTLVYGGGQTGLMGRVHDGAASEGGRTVGIAPKFFDEPGELCKSCDEFIFTDTMAERKTAMENMADAFIVLPGGIGTMEEFFETLTLKQLGVHAKPMAIVNVSGCYDHLAALLEGFAAEGLMSARGLGLYRIFTDPAQALEFAVNEKPGQATVSIADYSK